MRLARWRRGGSREEVRHVHSQDVSDVPQPLVSNAPLPPLDADDHDAGQPRLQPERLLGELLLNAEFSNSGPDLVAALLPTLQPGGCDL